MNPLEQISYTVFEDTPHRGEFQITMRSPEGRFTLVVSQDVYENASHQFSLEMSPLERINSIMIAQWKSEDRWYNDDLGCIKALQARPDLLYAIRPASKDPNYFTIMTSFQGKFMLSRYHKRDFAIWTLKPEIVKINLDLSLEEAEKKWSA